MEINGVWIDDTYAEAFPTWVSRVIITGVTRGWAEKAALEATGFATSAIGCPCEAGIEAYLTGEETPDGRPGVAVLFCVGVRVKKGENAEEVVKEKVKHVLIERIGECILTAPTTAVFDGLPQAPLRVPVKMNFFGDGFQERREVGGRKVFAIPIMGGEYIGEEEFGAVKGIAGGNFFVMGEGQMAALMGAQAAVEAINAVRNVILPFPGGIVSSGSKVGSNKYKALPASTNELYCPTLKAKVPNSKVPDGVKAIYEIVIDGLDAESIRKAMKVGILAATKVPGVRVISAGNYGGKLGPHQFRLHELF